MARPYAPPPIAVFGPLDADELATASKRAADAAIAAETALTEMRSIIAQHDQIQLLSRLAFLMIIGTIDPPSARTRPFLHAHELELLQALALSQPRVSTFEPATVPVAIEQLLHLAQEHTHAVHKMSLSALSGDSQRNKVEAVLDRIRATTYTVRGPRHAYQTRAYVRALATSMDGAFLKALGFSITDVADFIEGAAEHAGAVLAELRQASMPWMKREGPSHMLELFVAHNSALHDHPIIKRIESGEIPSEQVRPALMAIFEEQLPAAFKLNFPGGNANLPALRDQIRKLAIPFDGVTADELRHLKLGNPVRTKPFVLTACDELYIFCTQTCFANLVELIDEIAASDTKLKEGCEAFKARWLEQKLQQLVRDGFPSGQTFDNAKWKDIAGKPGETDCILVIDKTIGLFEAKSGRISAPARRGAEDRLKRKIETLLVAPSRQSERLADLLRSSSRTVALDLAEGTAEIDQSDVREIFRVNILFDTLGPLTAGTRRLVDIGFIDEAESMAPTMSIFELETLFDLLPDQISRLHYLRRRGEMERNVLVEADEMDLIALYLESSFCIRHLEEAKDGFSVYGWSDRIAKIYDHDGGRQSAVPVKRTPFFQGIISVIEKRRQPGWTRFGYRLSNIAYKDQWTILKRHGETAKKARRLKPGQAAHSGAYDADGSNRSVVGLCVGKNVSAFGIEAHSREVATEMVKLSGAAEGVVLYWDVDDKPGDLRFIGSFREGN